MLILHIFFLEYKDNNGAVLEELYTLFGIDTTKEHSIIKEHGKLINAGSVLREKILRPKDFNEAKFNGDSVERYLRSRLKEISSAGTYAPVELVAMWSVTELLRAYLPDSF